MLLITIVLHFLVLSRLTLADGLQCRVRDPGDTINAADCQAAVNLIPAIRLDSHTMAQNELDRLVTSAPPRMVVEFPEGAKTLSQLVVFHHGSCLILVQDTSNFIYLSQDSRAMHFWPAVKQRAQHVWDECVHAQGQEGWEWGTVPPPLPPWRAMRYIVKLMKGTDVELRYYSRLGFDIFPPLLAPGY